MSNRWLGVALVLVGLGCTSTAFGQQLPQGPAPMAMPEPMPMPCGQSLPPMIPGPISPWAAPPGPCDELGIPANIPGAFRDDWYCPEKHCYFNFGAQALQRRRPGKFPVAFTEPTNTVTTVIPRPGPDIVIREDISPRDSSPVNANGSNLTQDLSQIHPHYAWGPRATVGILFDGGAIEVTGYYIRESAAEVANNNSGRLDTLFVNSPPGFEGNNDLWTHADRVNSTLRSQLANVELNYRWWSKSLYGAECLIGLRYFDMQERLSIAVDDDGISRNGVDPALVATYTVLAHSRIVGPQFGLEYQCNALKDCIGIGGYAKAAGGANLVDVDVHLVRGDGLVGIDGNRSEITYSGIGDVGCFFEFRVLEKLRFRCGYTALWLLHVPTSQQQVDFNLQNTTGSRKDNGNVFYHGPMVEAQFVF